MLKIVSFAAAAFIGDLVTMCTFLAMCTLAMCTYDQSETKRNETVL
jgi:hypothetical protein